MIRLVLILQRILSKRHRIMLKTLKPYWLTLVVIFLIMAALSTAEVFYYLMIRDMIDATLQGEVIYFANNLITIGLLLTLFIVFLFIFNYLRHRFVKVAVTRMKTNYMNRVFQKNINEFRKDNNAVYLSSLTNDHDQIEMNFFDPILDILFSIAQFASGVILFTIVNPFILLIAIGLVVVNLIISMVASKPINRHNKERSELFGQYTSYIKEVLSAFHIIKNNNLDKRVHNEFSNKSTDIQQKGYTIDRIRSFIFALQNTSITFTFLGLIFTIGYMSINQLITFGSVILIVQTAEKIIWPIRNFSEALPKLFSVQSIFKRIEQSLVNQQDYIETLDFNHFDNTITLQNVSFGYDTTNVLENIDMQFKKGGKYLIVGPSGGGKSTILRLLRKYVNPKEGDILVDGIPLKDIKKEQYFSHIANIEQNVFLFEDTIRNNLTLFKDYSDEAIQDAIERSGLTDFIDGLPDGLDTMIYDNGKNISGGEKSRLVIARGLLNHADIILLDEAFASLDTERAKEIEKKLLELEDVTIINVSHVIFKEHQDLYDQTYVVRNKMATALS